MSEEIYNKIKNLLKEMKANFREVHHGPTKTSRESAEARGEPLEVGGKAILLKIDDTFRIFVLSAALRIDSVKIKKFFKAKRVRFATDEELHKLTGLVPGAIPPFGEPIFSLELYVDKSILKNNRIAFNAGSLTCSMVMSVNDYLRVSNPVSIFDFSKNKN